MRPRLTVDGFSSMDQRLGTVEELIADKRLLTDILLRRAQPVADRAREIVNVETGRLRDGIVVSEDAVDVAPDERGAASAFVGPTEDIYYADELEFGSPDGVRVDGRKYQGTLAHPYMRPAWDMEAGDMLQAIADDIGAAISRGLG